MRELGENLELFRKRYIRDGVYSGPKVWYVDNPNEVESYLKHGGKDGGSFKGFDIDGHELLVLADPFHMIKNVGDTLVSKHPLRNKFIGALTDILFALDERNVEFWKEHLIKSGRATEAEVSGVWDLGKLRGRCLPKISPLPR